MLHGGVACITLSRSAPPRTDDGEGSRDGDAGDDAMPAMPAMTAMTATTATRWQPGRR
jgi:hypothetical protein